MNYEIDKKSVSEINRALSNFTKAMRNKILRKGLRKWGASVAASIKSNVTWDGASFRRSVAIKTKSYRRGKILWMGVGLRSDGQYRGKLAHLFENGFRPRGRGDKIFNTKFISTAYAANASKLLPSIRQAIEEAIKERRP